MIIGRKVCLCPLMHGDAPAMFNWLNTVALAHWNGSYRPNDQMGFDLWYAAIAGDRSKVVFTIRGQGDLRLLGYVQVTNILPVCRSGEMGILIGDEADRGRGFGQEALQLALRHCWNDLNLHRVTLYVHGDNPRAIRSYAKAGFHDEGRMREAGYVNGRFVDIAVMGALRPTEEASAMRDGFSFSVESPARFDLKASGSSRFDPG